MVDNNRARYKWTAEQLHSLRSQLYSLDHIEGKKTIQIDMRTADALFELARRLPDVGEGEGKTYDIVIIYLINEYNKAHSTLSLSLPEPVISLFDSEEENA